MKQIVIITLLALAPGCASPWKIHGGPAECLQMCKNWNLEFAGMVGVGSQDSARAGATACVCQVPRPNAAAAKGGEAASSASLAGPITAAQAALAATAAALQMQQQQQVQRR